MQSVTVKAPGGPEVLELTEAAMPNPGPGEALVKVAYAALNPLDNHARADRIKWNHPGYPFTPGFEFCGLVDAVGEGSMPRSSGSVLLRTGNGAATPSLRRSMRHHWYQCLRILTGNWRVVSLPAPTQLGCWCTARPGSKRTSGSWSIQRQAPSARWSFKSPNLRAPRSLVSWVASISSSSSNNLAPMLLSITCATIGQMA